MPREAALFLAELIIGVGVAAKPRPRTWPSVTGFGTRAKAQNKPLYITNLRSKPQVSAGFRLASIKIQAHSYRH
jgi:hypothetical protein